MTKLWISFWFQDDQNDSAESYDFGDSNDDSSLSFSDSVEEQNNEQTDTLRNVLLELSRAAQIIEDKQKKYLKKNWWQIIDFRMQFSKSSKFKR